MRLSYETWVAVSGNPQNLEKWLFEPNKTGMLPEVFSKNGSYQNQNENYQSNRERKAINDFNTIERVRESVAARDRELRAANAPDRE